MIVAELSMKRFPFGLETPAKLIRTRFDLSDRLVEQDFVGADGLNLFDNKAFNFAGGHGGCWALGPTLLHRGAADVIAVSFAAFAAIRMRHRPPTGFAPDQTL